MTNSSLNENLNSCNTKNISQYVISFHITIERDMYDEHPGLATYETDSVKTYYAQSVHEAIVKVEEIYNQSSDCDFNIKYVKISDSEDKLLLAGENKQNRIIWINPIKESEIKATKELIKELYSQASMEIGYDNYETARQLTKKATLLQFAFIDEKYINHPDVRCALQRNKAHY